MCKAFVLIAAFTIFYSHVQGQQAPSIVIGEQFDDYRRNNFQEKIFVHTDKNNYVPGEICWFKIYNVDGYFHKIINFGKIAYVEILDKNNLAVLQAKIPLEKGTGDGSLYLPATLATGNYRLRAYTNWMKNYGADYFFEKRLTIINVQKAQPQNVVSQINTYDIALFPEGGNLVNGIESKVGFKVINRFGKGVDADGKLLNEKDETIASFHSLKFGIGNFKFTPLAGSNYRAVINLPGGEKQVKALPAAYNTGYAMQLVNSGNGQIKILVQNPDGNNTSPASIFLFVHTRNVVKVAMSNALLNGRAEFVIDEAKLGDGISHLTLFNEYRQPVCERLFFKKPVRSLRIMASTDLPVYGLRKKMNIDIDAVAEDGKSIPANMSMAVYRIEPFMVPDEQSINSYFLLGADLSGNVESPGYYFVENNDTVTTAVDNLMLTQGWRKFSWESILSNRKPAFRYLPEINGHIINGKVIAETKEMPLQDVKAYLSVPGTRMQFQTATADKEGSVKFELKNFYNNGEIIAQTNNERDSQYRVEITSPFVNTYSAKALPPFDNLVHNDALLPAYVASQVQNAYSYNKLNSLSLPELDTTSFYLKPDATYLLDNYVRFTTIDEVLREYVMEVNVRRWGGKVHLPVYDAIAQAPFSFNPLVLLDGLPVFDFNKIMKYDPFKIRKLEVVTRQYHLGDDSFNGIISFTTYKGNMEGFEMDPRATVLDYEGLQLKRDFYKPVYETREQLLSRIPDFRSLLYWSPNLQTSGGGKIRKDFYTSDLPGRYAVVIQGIGEDGRAGTGVAYFDVQKP